MKKNFVFATNVLLHDPDAIFKFEDNHVIIPIYVIEEIDTFKKDLSETGRNARTISRHLDELRQQVLEMRAVFRRGRETADDVTRGFALIRESAFRAIGLKAYPTQIAAALAIGWRRLGMSTAGPSPMVSVRSAAR